MRYEVKLPDLGDEDDAVRGGTVSMWLAREGAQLNQDDDLLELTTDKAAFVVPCPTAGTLTEKHVAEGDEVRVGNVLCVLET
ncbi:MAG: biotin/lipoyl-containing protein [Candidatus Hydrogenedentota bacterium]